MNRLARSAREGLWTGIGLGAFLLAVPFVGFALIFAFAVNPTPGVIVTILRLLWPFRGHHHVRKCDRG